MHLAAAETTDYHPHPINLADHVQWFPGRATAATEAGRRGCWHANPVPSADPERRAGDTQADMGPTDMEAIGLYNYRVKLAADLNRLMQR